MDIVSEVREFVRSECMSPNNQYTFEIFDFHLVPVHKYAKQMAWEMNADIEVVELASWLHDIGLIRHGRKNHHATGARIAEEKLNKLGYDSVKARHVRDCVFSHRGSEDIPRNTLEEEIVANADGMAHFDTIGGLFKVSFILHPDWDQGQVSKALRDKYERSFSKMMPEAQRIIRPKYEAAMLLL